MYSLGFFLIGLAHLWFLWQAWKLYRREPNWYLPLAMICLASLIYDCWAIAAGRFLGEGPLLQAVSRPRFYTHALFTPLLIIFAFGLARRLGARWAGNRAFHAVICLFALALIVLGAREDILHLTFAPKTLGDSLRYANAAAKGPPMPAILVNVFFLLIGGWLWRKTKSAAFFLGSLFMFIIAPLTPKLPLLGNFGELGISFAIITGEKLAQARAAE
jgi:hypothetical protein